MRSAAPSWSSGLLAAVLTAVLFSLQVALDHILLGPLPLGDATPEVIGAGALGALVVLLLTAPPLMLSFGWWQRWILARPLFCFRVALFFALLGLFGVGLFATIDPTEAVLTPRRRLFYIAAFLLAIGVVYPIARYVRPGGSYRRIAALLLLGGSALCLWLLALLPPYNSDHLIYNAVLLGVGCLSLAGGVLLILAARGLGARGALLLSVVGFLTLASTAVPFLLRFQESYAVRDAAARGGRLSRTLLRHLAPLLIPQDGLWELANRASPRDPASPASTDGELWQKLNAARPTHILLITVDALRADTVSTQSSLSSFARLAEEGVSFSSFYTGAPATREAMQVLFLGRWDWARGVPEGPSLFEVFQKEGFYTLAVLGTWQPLLDSWPSRGFDKLLSPERSAGALEMDAEEVTDALLASLSQRDGKPFLAWAHYIEPHAPYHAEDGKPRERYLAEVSRVDRAIERLLAALSREGILEETLVLFSADHGEEFGEHGGTFHNRMMYDETIRVPLVLRAPGGAVRGLISSPASAIDVGPALLALAGITRPQEFAPFGKETLAAPDRTVFSFRGPAPRRSQYEGVACAMRGGYKLIYDLRLKSAELYHLARDPQERENLIEREPEVAAALARDLLEELRRGGLKVH